MLYLENIPCVDLSIYKHHPGKEEGSLQRILPNNSIHSHEGLK